MNLKRAVAARARQLVAYSVAPRFDDLTQRIEGLAEELRHPPTDHLSAAAAGPRFDELAQRIDALTEQLRDPGYPTTRVELDLFALRQQMEETLDLLRVQHDRLREVSDRLCGQQHDVPR